MSDARVDGADIWRHRVTTQCRQKIGFEQALKRNLASDVLRGVSFHAH